MIRPFDRSTGGGSQLSDIVVELVAMAVIFRGGAPGTNYIDGNGTYLCVH